MINAKTITVDKDTKERLDRAAGTMPLARYLRDLSRSITGDIDHPVEKRLASVEAEINTLTGRVFSFEGTLESFIKAFTMNRKNKDGEWVPVEPMKDSRDRPMTQIEALMIQDAVEKDPNCSHVGWYNKNKAGKWVFNQKAWNKWVKVDNARKDREYAERENEAGNV